MHTGAEFVNSSFLTESFCLSYSVAIDIKTNDILCQLRRQSLNNFGFKSFDDNSCLPEHQMLNTLEISLQEELLTTILITFSDDCFFGQVQRSSKKGQNFFLSSLKRKMGFLVSFVFDGKKKLVIRKSDKL